MNRKGFTLIELLVVIAIIALLLAIIMPSLKKVKETAKTMLCSSNLRQMSMAFTTYSIDNDGKAFPFSYGGQYGYWFRNIAPYMGDDDFRTNDESRTSGVMKVGICPGTKIQTDDADGLAPDNKSTWYWSHENIIGSYGVNAWVLPDPDQKAVFFGLSADETEKRFFKQYAQIPGNVGILADSFRMDNWPSTPQDVEVPTAEQLIKPTAIMHDLKYFMLRYTVDRHGMGVNVAFVDTSVERVKIEDLYSTKWNKEDTPVEVQIPRP